MTGFIFLDKPEGITSFTAVNKTRRLLGIKKAGHTGTLDPMRTGVLPVLTENFTKLSDIFPSDKAYICKIVLGIETVAKTCEYVELVARTHCAHLLSTTTHHLIYYSDGISIVVRYRDRAT